MGVECCEAAPFGEAGVGNGEVQVKDATRGAVIDAVDGAAGFGLEDLEAVHAGVFVIAELELVAFCGFDVLKFVDKFASVFGKGFGGCGERARLSVCHAGGMKQGESGDDREQIGEGLGHKAGLGVSGLVD